MRHPFTIPIGDWSGDGHGKCRRFNATSAKPIDAVRDAYFKSKALHPSLCPESLCDRYEEATIQPRHVDALTAAGCPMPADLDDFGVDSMAQIVAWFINQGDPDVDVKIEPEEKVPMLPFYGSDAHGRHIRHIGYGLL